MTYEKHEELKERMLNILREFGNEYGIETHSGCCYSPGEDPDPGVIEVYDDIQHAYLTLEMFDPEEGWDEE